MTGRPAAALIASLWALVAFAGEPDGERLYREGILADGNALEALSPEGVALSGAEAACARCHQRSGFGASEGGTTVAPLPLLFTPPAATNLRARPVGTGRADPRYDEAGLARALRDGLTPDGRRLASPMPRYRIDDSAVATLAAYLRSLGSGVEVGVSGDEIRLATIVAPGAPPGEGEAMLAVMRTFVAEHNADPRKEWARRTACSDWMSVAFRRWVLEAWTLDGPPASWPAQLDARYRSNPPFAIVGGSGTSWSTVEAFCDAHQIPCLMPLSPAPGPTPSRYAVYFTGGAAFEGRVLAHHLRESGARSVLQVRPLNGPGQEAAAALRAALPGVAIEEMSPGDSLASREPRDAVVLWTGAEEGSGWVERVVRDLAPAKLYVSQSLWAGEPPATARVVSVFDAPAGRNPRLGRARAWLDGRRLGPADAARCNTLFAMMMVGESLTHLGLHAYRERLLERTEHMASRTPNVSWYPRLSLGPGQRIASKGAYVLESRQGTWQPLGDWIVP